MTAAQFKRAPALRRVIGDAELIASSQFALEAVEARPGAGYPVGATPSF